MADGDPEWREAVDQAANGNASSVSAGERQAQERLHDLTRLVSDWIWEIDRELKLTYVSPRVTESLGYHPVEIVGHTFEELGDFTPADRGPPGWRSPFRDRSIEILNQAGEQRFLLISGLPIFSDEGGKFEGARGTARNVTARRYAEQRLVAAKREAELANHTKSDFLANMSHELRTPLNAIIGFAEMMVGEMYGKHASPKYGEYAADIVHSADLLPRIIDDILDISKIEAGQLDIKPQALAVEDTIASCLSLFRHRALKLGVHLVDEVESGLTMIADPRLLRQILINLLSNAVKFTPAGGTVTVSARSGPDGSPLITVADTGIGIAAENISEVLKPFVRVESAFNADVEGTGLGLPLVKSYVELHGGSLEIESQPDVGTTVRLHFAAEGGGEDDSAGKAQRQTG